jgi:hypothetical protein
MLHLLQKATKKKKLERSKVSGNSANVTEGAQENFKPTDKKKQTKKYTPFTTNKSKEFLLSDCECVNGGELIKPKIKDPPRSGNTPFIPFKTARHHKASMHYKSFNHVNFITFNSITPWSRVLRDSNIVKKFPTFYVIRKVITTFTTALPSVPVLSQINPVRAPISLLGAPL